MKRVAFFVLGWPVCTYTMELAEALAADGVQVDFFFDQSFTACIDFPDHLNSKNITLYYLKNENGLPITRTGFDAWIEDVVCAVIEYSKVPYDVMIGVEKIGVSIAYMVGKMTGAPYLYWSMELYDLHNTHWVEWASLPALWLQLESEAKKKALATIVQDKDRGKILDTITGCEGKKIYYPIVIGSKYVTRKNTKMLYRLYNIDKKKRILFQFGTNRMKPESIMRMLESLPENWVCVMQGRSISASCSGISHDKLFVFSGNMTESEIPFVVSSATAGLVHYDPLYANDALTVRSSEKMARYLAAGVPVVVHAVGNYPEYITSSQCGVLYDDAAQIGSAVTQIEENYIQYKAAALEAGKQYIFENVSTGLIQFIKSI